MQLTNRPVNYDKWQESCIQFYNFQMTHVICFLNLFWTGKTKITTQSRFHLYGAVIQVIKCKVHSERYIYVRKRETSWTFCFEFSGCLVRNDVSFSICKIPTLSLLYILLYINSNIVKQCQTIIPYKT